MAAPESNSSKRLTLARIRRKQVVEGRLQGVSFRQLAEDLGVNKSSAVRLYQREMADLAVVRQGLASTLVELEDSKLDEVEREAWSMYHTLKKQAEAQAQAQPPTLTVGPGGSLAPGTGAAVQPNWAAMDACLRTILRSHDRRARLHGLWPNEPMPRLPPGSLPAVPAAILNIKKAVIVIDVRRKATLP